MIVGAKETSQNRLLQAGGFLRSHLPARYRRRY